MLVWRLPVTTVVMTDTQCRTSSRSEDLFSFRRFILLQNLLALLFLTSAHLWMKDLNVFNRGTIQSSTLTSAHHSWQVLTVTGCDSLSRFRNDWRFMWSDTTPVMTCSVVRQSEIICLVFTVKWMFYRCRDFSFYTVEKMYTLDVK